MGMNSIKNNLSKEDIISDILLCMGADINKENTYLLVEGEDDIKFLQLFLGNNVFIYESYSGKNGVKYITEKHFSQEFNVLGIVDKDYQIMSTSSSKVFYYDYNCMEMMIIKNDNVFENLCAEYYKGKDSFQELRKNILEQLKYLSIIRMYNEREEWQKKINGVSIKSAWNNTQKQINNQIILKKLNSMNNDFFDNNIQQKINQEYQKVWSEIDFYNYTQGHDFCTLYTVICNTFLKTQIKFSSVEASNRCIFREYDFKKTDLYKKINLYEEKHNLKICNFKTNIIDK